MTKRVCSVDGCDRPHRGRGFCRNHLRIFNLYGDPEKVALRKHWPETLTERLLPQTSGCIWHDSAPTDQGYAIVSRDGGQQFAHRAAWELVNGPIPDGMTIDHECHNDSGCTLTDHRCPHRRCVNVEHLAVKAQGENVSASPNSNAAKTHCPQGHQYTEENTYVVPSSGARRCRTCNRERARRP